MDDPITGNLTGTHLSFSHPPLHLCVSPTKMCQRTNVWQFKNMCLDIYPSYHNQSTVMSGFICCCFFPQVPTDRLMSQTFMCIHKMFEAPYFNIFLRRKTLSGSKLQVFFKIPLPTSSVCFKHYISSKASLNVFHHKYLKPPILGLGNSVEKQRPAYGLVSHFSDQVAGI